MLSIFVFIRIILYFTKQHACFPLFQDSYHGTITANKRFAIGS